MFFRFIPMNYHFNILRTVHRVPGVPTAFPLISSWFKGLKKCQNDFNYLAMKLIVNKETSNHQLCFTTRSAIIPIMENNKEKRCEWAAGATLLYIFVIFIVFETNDFNIMRDTETFLSFLAGIASPVVFLWIVRGLYIQKEELRLNTEALIKQTEALDLQAQELNSLVELNRSLSESQERTAELLASEGKAIWVFVKFTQHAGKYVATIRNISDETVYLITVDIDDSSIDERDNSNLLRYDSCSPNGTISIRGLNITEGSHPKILISYTTKRGVRFPEVYDLATLENGEIKLAITNKREK